MNAYQSGFTLVELIITIAVSAILASVLIQFTGAGLVNSTENVLNTRENFSADQVMAQITRDYQVWLSTGAGDLNQFHAQVLANYSGSISTAETGMVDLKPGEDETGSILQVTVVRKNFKLSTLFTR